jgi:hypothetical protein
MQRIRLGKESSGRDACQSTLTIALRNIVSAANPIGDRLDLSVASLRSQ